MLGFGRARPVTVEALLRDLFSPELRVRIEAADASSLVVADASDADRARIVAALAKMLDIDGQPMARAAAALALADVSAHEALPALLVAAEDSAAIVRQQAISALGEIGDVRACERIRRALGDDRPEVRFQAIVAYPRLAKQQATDGELGDVWSALETGLVDEDAQVRGRAAEACAELADAEPLPKKIGDRLAKMATDKKETADARVAASIALGESGDRRGSETLLDVMAGRIDEPSPGRVQASFELAGELGLEHARAEATSVAFGLRGRFGDPGRRAAALVALVRLGDRRAIDHVLGELSSSSFTRRMTALGIVSRSALAEARPKLESMRDRPSLLDPDAVTDALAKIS
ncbi:MAG: HEAT repeat domain-containing protein [Polyangiales bacterium]